MIPALHVVTDDQILARDDFETLAREILAAGGSDLALHLRGPQTSGAVVYAAARSLREAAASSGSLLLVNDRVDVALAADLDGVQLGSRSLPTDEVRTLIGSERLIGVSIHTVEEGRVARRMGADFLVAGTIFATASHPGLPGMGVGHLARLAGATPLPVLAIGGMTEARVDEVAAAGAQGIAVVGRVWRTANPVASVRVLVRALEGALLGTGQAGRRGRETE